MSLVWIDQFWKNLLEFVCFKIELALLLNNFNLRWVFFFISFLNAWFCIDLDLGHKKYYLALKIQKRTGSCSYWIYYCQFIELMWFQQWHGNRWAQWVWFWTVHAVKAGARGIESTHMAGGSHAGPCSLRLLFRCVDCSSLFRSIILKSFGHFSGLMLSPTFMAFDLS